MGELGGPGTGVPLLGALFRGTSKSHTQQEMLVFITPRIVPLERVDRVSARIATSAGELKLTFKDVVRSSTDDRVRFLYDR